MAKSFVVVVLVVIVASLGSAMFYLVRDKSGGDRTVKALTLRIGLSVFLFAMLYVFYGLGWIKPHGFIPG